MGGVNPAIQLAAALDRRGITVLVDGDRLRIRLGGYREHIVLSGWASGIAPQEAGRSWHWDYGGKSGSHPVADPEGAAAAIEAFLRADRGLAGTPLLYRMDHIGWTLEQEEAEIVACSARSPGAGASPRP